MGDDGASEIGEDARGDDLDAEQGEPSYDAAEVESDTDEGGETADDLEDAPEGRIRSAPPRADPLLQESQRLREVVVVPDEDRKTSNILCDLEFAQCLALRAKGIADTGKHCAEGVVGVSDPVSLAYIEICTRRCPLVLEREMGTGPRGERVVERWVVREMAIYPATPPTAEAAAFIRAKAADRPGRGSTPAAPPS
ncbi:MAG TPA: hypothetical protein VNI01_01390 [Elusimicrobiota bacterium]|jgi:hypothetical protein|nr:hypothetical protein [Elusimicrobiota bacterium]